MQRDVVIPGGPSGTVQDIANTANAEIFGVELDGSFVLADRLVLHGSLGFLDARYTDIWYDITGDKIADSQDKNLDLIRAPVWTYSLGLRHSVPIGSRLRLDSRVQYAYRDREYSQDNNALYNRQLKKVDIGLDLHLDNSQWVVGLYGKNLLDEVGHGINGVSPRSHQRFRQLLAAVKRPRLRPGTDLFISWVAESVVYSQKSVR